MNFKFNWGEIHKISTNYGDLWERRCMIPFQCRNEFFSYWRKNSISLKQRGFNINKINDQWFIIETKTLKDKFKEYKKPEIEKDEEKYSLSPIIVKNEKLLRPWQIGAVGRLCAAIKKWNCAIDGSDMGIGKTYNACGVARELNMNIAIICPKAVIESWRRVIKYFEMDDKLIGIINYESLRIGKTE